MRDGTTGVSGITYVLGLSTDNGAIFYNDNWWKPYEPTVTSEEDITSALVGDVIIIDSEQDTASGLWYVLTGKKLSGEPSHTTDGVWTKNNYIVKKWCLYFL